MAKNKMTTCKHCGAEIAASAKVCPQCGGKNKPPIYKRWWFIVIIVLIVSAGLLAFVVLYNLANVNISERIRELATIKVLGFYDKEVYDYVARETVILTIIGIGLGLVRRIFLELLPDGYL